MKLIKRLLEATFAPQPKKDLFADISTHLGLIIDARNTVLHYGLTSMGDNQEMVATNLRIALREGSEKRIPFSIETLKNLTADTMKINFHLIVELGWGSADSFQSALQQPWLYKPLSA